MAWESISLEELKGMGKRIDSEFVVAENEPDLYTQLNTSYPHDQWALLRAPAWCGDKLVALVVKPRTE